jgi:hypothetical protein
MEAVLMTNCATIVLLSNNATRVGKKDGDDEEDDVNNVKKLLLATENHANSSNVKLDSNHNHIYKSELSFYRLRVF